MDWGLRGKVGWTGDYGRKVRCVVFALALVLDSGYHFEQCDLPFDDPLRYNDLLVVCLRV